MMARPHAQLWAGVAVGLLGLAVGASNLSRGVGDEQTLRHLLLGGVCLALATGWLTYLFLHHRHTGRNEQRGSD